MSGIIKQTIKQLHDANGDCVVDSFGDRFFILKIGEQYFIQSSYGMDAASPGYTGYKLSTDQSWRPDYINKKRSFFAFKPLIGSDPEMFVKVGADVLPAFEFLRDKKNAGWSSYWDGFQAEFNTDPFACLQEFCMHIKDKLLDLEAQAKKKNKDAKVVNSTLVTVTQEILDKTAPEHKAFGCAPSYNAYNLTGMTTNGDTAVHRSAGGHLHFNTGQIGREKLEQIVKFLDATVGVASVALFANLDDPRRRRAYGLAGEYRMPKHGLEYRVLSNAWLCHPLAAHITIDLARRALSAAMVNHTSFMKYDEQQVVDIINTCDVTAAKAYLQENMKGYLEMMTATYGNMDMAQAVFNIFLSGIDSAVMSTENVIENWSKSALLTGSYKAGDTILAGKKVV